MTRQTLYTQAAITRAIKAALNAGLVVTAVRPDGTVLTERAEAVEKAAPPSAGRLTAAPKLRDAREKLRAG
jgi:hypothetical protein